MRADGRCSEAADRALDRLELLVLGVEVLDRGCQPANLLGCLG